MTIFGFNTDVRQGDVVYHVQSEARQHDLLLQTLIFQKGQCVGKHTFSYAQKISEPGFSSEAMHELLKAQHKRILEAIQEGEIESVLGSGSAVQDVGGAGLSLKWLTSALEPGSSTLGIEVQVFDSEHPAASSRINVTTCTSADGPAICAATTDDSGNARLSVPLNEEIVRESAVMIRALHGGKSVTRKVRFKI